MYFKNQALNMSRSFAVSVLEVYLKPELAIMNVCVSVRIRVSVSVDASVNVCECSYFIFCPLSTGHSLYQKE